VTPACERGSATIWVLACCALVMLLGYLGVARTETVLARHRADAAADLAALAAAGRLGVGTDVCDAASELAAANGAAVRSCSVRLAADGRSGTVRIQVAVTVQLPFAGARTVVASARAGREQVRQPSAG
jgi:secretion/DNA translocation related TadE-like protein